MAELGRKADWPLSLRKAAIADIGQLPPFPKRIDSENDCEISTIPDRDCLLGKSASIARSVLNNLSHTALITRRFQPFLKKFD